MCAADLPTNVRPTALQDVPQPRSASRRRADLRTVSLVCIETRYPELARYALQRCLDAAEFKECILLTSALNNLPDSIRQIVIAPLSSVEAYSEFVIHELGKYFSGTHVLIVQWDSFILNPESWDAEFLAYDYIGALFVRRPVQVGNGGFSLRSRKLIEALTKLEIGDDSHPEDRYICERLRNTLIAKHNIRFAPPEVACRFAFEGVPSSQPTFGFHGFFNFNGILTPEEMTDYLEACDTPILMGRPARSLVKSLYRAGHYETARYVINVRIDNGDWKLVIDTWILSLRCRLHQWGFKNI